MAKVTGKYETLYIIRPNMSEEETAAVVAKFKDLVEANGTLVDMEEWGKRKLAYEINDFTEGYYVLLNYTSPAAFPAELDRVFKITESVIRSLIIAKEV